MIYPANTFQGIGSRMYSKICTQKITLKITINSYKYKYKQASRIYYSIGLVYSVVVDTPISGFVYLQFALKVYYIYAVNIYVVDMSACKCMCVVLAACRYLASIYTIDKTTLCVVSDHTAPTWVFVR